MDAVAETVQPMVPQLVTRGIPTIDTLNENTGIWIPATSAIIRTLNTTHGSAPVCVVGKRTVVGEAVVNYREGNYKRYFKIARKNSKLQSKRKDIETIRPSLYLTFAGVKTSDAKKTATDSSTPQGKP